MNDLDQEIEESNRQDGDPEIEELNRQDGDPEIEELNRQDAKIAKKEKEERGEEERGEEEREGVIRREKILLEPEKDVDDLARQVIGAAIEVHRHLGPGFLEGVYEDALALELAIRGICFERQKPVVVLYKGTLVGEGRLDFLIAGSLIIELKAVDGLAAIHKAQVLSYLKATRLRLGLLINFNVPILKERLQRVVLT